MKYTIEFKPGAFKDLKKLDKQASHNIVEKIESLKNGLSGDVKHLTNFTPEYRLRVGDYRVLFEVEGEKVVIYRVKHRKEVYR